jgi:hypothetical protein
VVAAIDEAFVDDGGRPLQVPRCVLHTPVRASGATCPWRQLRQAHRSCPAVQQTAVPLLTASRFLCAACKREVQSINRQRRCSAAMQRCSGQQENAVVRFLLADTCGVCCRRRTSASATQSCWTTRLMTRRSWRSTSRSSPRSPRSSRWGPLTLVTCTDGFHACCDGKLWLAGRCHGARAVRNHQQPGETGLKQSCTWLWGLLVRDPGLWQRALGHSPVPILLEL